MANRQNYYPPRRPIYPYYGGYGSYPQYRGLTSGIDMIGSNSFSAGMESMMQSLIDIERVKYEDEEKKQEKFQGLIDVSLEDVRYRWRDEGKAKYDKFMSNATKMATENQGQLNWEQTKELEQGKKDLEQFAGMSKEVSNWYNDAVMKALQLKLKDPEAGDQTLQNINKIMDDTNGLAETYKLTQDPTWLGTGHQTYDVMTDVLDPIPSPKKVVGNQAVPDKKATRENVKTIYDSGDKKMMMHYDNWLKTEPVATKDKSLDDQFIDYVTAQKLFTQESKSSKDYKYYPPYKPTGPSDTRTPLSPEANGDVRFNSMNKGKGIQIGSIIGHDGKKHKGASIMRETTDPKTNKRVYEVSYNIPNQSVEQLKKDQQELAINKIIATAKKKNITREEAWEQGGEELYNKWLQFDYAQFIKELPDGTYVQTIFVPKEDYEQMVASEVIIKKDEADPLGILN